MQYSRFCTHAKNRQRKTRPRPARRVRCIIADVMRQLRPSRKQSADFPFFFFQNRTSNANICMVRSRKINRGNRGDRSVVVVIGCARDAKRSSIAVPSPRLSFEFIPCDRASRERLERVLSSKEPNGSSPDP